MIFDVEEAYDEAPKFVFNPDSDCQPDFTCINVTRDSDSITFTGKLTTVPTNYTATLKNGTHFTFVFGKELAVQSTVQSTAQPSLSTKETDHPQTTPPGQTTASSDSNGNETGGGGGDEHETVPTTSNGRLNMASVAVLLLAVLIPFTTHLLS